MKQELQRLQSLYATLINDDVEDQQWNWLAGLSASQAFLACIGAGPWKIKRRQEVQRKAILALGTQDLCSIYDVTIFQFPLEWQRTKVRHLISYLHQYNLNMNTQFIYFLSSMIDPVSTLYDVTRTKGRAKVLDLFARDYLKVDAFPIDRWVERKLIEHDLPVDEVYMINLCKEANIDPRKMARLLVHNSNFSGNPKIIDLL